MASNLCRALLFQKHDCAFPFRAQNRLRTEYLKKSRIAGLCGRGGGDIAVGPLSCTKIERKIICLPWPHQHCGMRRRCGHLFSALRSNRLKTGSRFRWNGGGTPWEHWEIRSQDVALSPVGQIKRSTVPGHKPLKLPALRAVVKCPGAEKRQGFLLLRFRRRQIGQNGGHPARSSIHGASPPSMAPSG